MTNDIKIGDSVRIYKNDNYFLEGKILGYTSKDGQMVQVEIDWNEHYSIHKPEDLELEYREGVWSWKILNEGIIRSEPLYFSHLGGPVKII